MNKIFSFHKEFNYKKLLLVISIILFLFSIIFYITVTKKENRPITKIISPYKTFYSSDKTITLTLSKDYKLKSVNSFYYKLDVESDDNLDIYVSREDLIPDRTLEEVVTADQRNYEEKFSLTANSTVINTINYKGQTGYTYSFHYLDNDKKTTYYLQIFWFEYNGYYYIVDIEFPFEKMNQYSTIINDVLNNLDIK